MDDPDIPQCKQFDGEIRKYQSEAIHVRWVELAIETEPWEWIDTTCGTPFCLTPQHLRANAPQRLHYPAGTCTYCGAPSGTKDHLIPRNWSGETGRRFVLTVPACAECNSLINDHPATSITDRRKVAHKRLRRKKARTLAYVDYTPEQMREFGRALRDSIAGGLEEKKRVLRRLEWPTDPDYDRRALEKSGIPDAYAIGLIHD